MATKKASSGGKQEQKPRSGPEGTYSKDFLLELYQDLYKIRVFETECVKLYRQGLIRGYFHPYLGEEAIAVGTCSALKADDYIVSTHRGHGHCIAKGANLSRMVAEVLSKKTGYCLGMGGSMHIADVETGNLGANGIVGGGIAMGVGAALGSSIRGDGRVAVVFFSDGASNNGIFPESLNLAAAFDLPVIFLCENNHYAVCTPVEKSCKTEDLYTIGEGFGITSHMVDGNDVLAVYEQVQEAAAACREKKGPVMIEAKTYRHAGHHVNDPGTYMPQDRLDYFRSKDPVKVCAGYCLSIGAASQTELDDIHSAVEKEMEGAIAFAKESPEMTLDEFLAYTEAF